MSFIYVAALVAAPRGALFYSREREREREVLRRVMVMDPHPPIP